MIVTLKDFAPYDITQPMFPAPVVAETPIPESSILPLGTISCPPTGPAYYLLKADRYHDEILMPEGLGMACLTYPGPVTLT